MMALRRFLPFAAALAIVVSLQLEAQQPAGEPSSNAVDTAYEQEVANGVAILTRREVASLECPPASSLQPGGRFQCRGTFGDGLPVVLEMETLRGGAVNIITINGEVPVVPQHAPAGFGRIVGVGATALAFVAGLVSIVAVAVFLRMYRGQYMTDPLVPLPSQAVFFPAAANYVLYFRGPRKFFWELWGKPIGLWDPIAAEYVRSWGLGLLNFRSSGLSTVQRAHKGFAVPRPGEYALVVGELEEGRTYHDRLIFGKASLPRLMALLAVTILSFFVALTGAIVGMSVLR